MNNIIISDEHNPYYNLALEEELLKSIDNDNFIFYLWQNDKTIVIGHNQNPYIECDIDKLKLNNVCLARRLSGGGAVFHDLGNLNFTFITTIQNKNLKKQLQVLKNALETFNIKIEISGRNDLLCDGKKFSGHAFYEEDNFYYHHGTLMIDVNTKMLSELLKPSKLKLESKGIKSTKSRVINLIKKCPYININTVSNALIESFIDLYGNSKVIHLNQNVFKPKFLSKYKSKDWIYGESPKYSVKLEKRFENIGNLQILLDINSNIIENAKIYSDTLENINFKHFENKLINNVFDEKNIFDMLEKTLVK